MMFTMKSSEKIGQQYAEKFGSSEDLIQAWRVSANRGVTDRFEELLREAVRNNKPADLITFVENLYPTDRFA